MPRPLRSAPGELVYHVLNRANGRRTIFEGAGDYAAFERTLAESQEHVPIRILAWCLMPNHWHLVLWPRQDGELSAFMHRLTMTHTQRWHAHRATAGNGHLYQGRFKSFVIQEDAHLLTVIRYVEANPLRAGLVRRAEDWRWSSLWRAQAGSRNGDPDLCSWPIARPQVWMDIVNQSVPQGHLNALRLCANRGTPYGQAEWSRVTAERLGLESTLRERGRPRKREVEDPGSLSA